MTEDRSPATFQPDPFADSPGPEPTGADLAGLDEAPGAATPPGPRSIPRAPWMGSPPPSRPAPSRRGLLGGVLGFGGFVVVAALLARGSQPDPGAWPLGSEPEWRTETTEPGGVPEEGLEAAGEVRLGDAGVSLPVFVGWQVADVTAARVILTRGDARVVVRTWAVGDSGSTPADLLERELSRYAAGFTSDGSEGAGGEMGDGYVTARFRAHGTMGEDPVTVAVRVSVRSGDDRALAAVSRLPDDVDPVVERQLEAVWDAVVAAW